MRIFNLTDKKPPFQSSPADPRVILVGGCPIPAGEDREVPNLIHRKTFNGLVRRGIISVDKLPEWYQRARRAESDTRTSQGE